MPIQSEKFVVLDVETNGLSSLRDDLLSVSIYQPDTGKTFNRFLPLELNDNVYTTHINGIKKKDLKKATPLTQEDVDSLILEFDLENRTILTYGNIDEKFIKNYFERKRLDGFKKLHFYNFKRNIIASSFSGGNVTKDNLCKIYGIGIVQKQHTGINDCILEWELFKRMDNHKLFVTNDKVFEFNEDYVIPISYLSTYPNFKYHITNLQYISYTSTEIERLYITSKKIKKFPTNFNGMIVEHLINSMLFVEKIDSSDYLIKNKSKLKYIGKLPSTFDDVFLNFRPDGTVSAVLEKDKRTETELNQFVSLLKQEISPLILYISQKIFNGEKIYSQELVVNQNENVLALCDLSSKSAVLEIKTNGNLDINKFKEQLYYEANGRACYVLQMDWTQLPKKIGFVLSKVDLVAGRAPRKQDTLIKLSEFIQELNNEEIEVVEYVNKSSKIKLKCKTCGYEWQCSYYIAIKKSFCQNCYPMVKDKQHSKQIFTEGEKKEFRAQKYQQKVIDKSDGRIEIIKYTGSKDNATAKCSECGYEWNSRADHLLSRPYCPRCKRGFD